MIKELKFLYIRVDADKNIGIGHLMRCLSLAQAWKDSGGKVVFIAGRKSRNALLERRLNCEGMDIHYLSASIGSIDDANQTANYITKDSWLILDGYHFDGTYQKIIKQKVPHLLFIDDLGNLENYCADIVLNQDYVAGRSLYKHRSKGTMLLLGPRYILLRREFWKRKGFKRVLRAQAKRILVVMGGSDPHNATLKVIEALKLTGITGLEVSIVIGPANPHGSVLKRAVKSKGIKFKLIENVGNMATLMAWAEICISAGGSTCWELAFMGLPTLMLTVADNQIESTRRLQNKGIVKDLGDRSKIMPLQIAGAVHSILGDVGRRKRMSNKGQALVDGEGARRVLMALSNQGKN